jgi:hypothetical protein
MKRIPASVHRSLDMLAIIGFLAAPLLLQISGRAALLSYALAAVQLLLTLATKFPDTRHKLLSLKAHGIVELVVGIALVVLPWLAGWEGTERTYYVVVGVVLLTVWASSNYGRQFGAERTGRTQRTPRAPRTQRARG